jgi:predicted ATPase/DNA-binding SARP family transcriptional activator
MRGLERQIRIPETIRYQDIAPLTIRLLGGFAVLRDGVMLPRTRSRTEQWLLAHLTLHPDQPVDRDWLAGTFWPDASEEAALANLRRSLSDLRRVLGPDADRLSSPNPRTICLALAGAKVDVAEFDAAVARGDVDSLLQAVSLYSGPLLEGCIGDWTVPEREAREQAIIRALEGLAAHYLERCCYADATACLRRVIGVDGFRESTQRRLMEVLARTGDYASVTQVYRDLRVRLRADLNTEPSQQTSDLYQDIRAQASSHAEERSSADSTAPSVAAASIEHTDNFPQALTTFIGREMEISDLTRLLTETRLLTLTGPGGCGKTRLALELARSVRDQFADGVWLVELAPISDPALVVHAVASAVNAPEEPGLSPEQNLSMHLRSKTLLLVLDNCEHIVQTCAFLAEDLLLDCPGLLIVSASREGLGISAETRYRVPTLSLPSGGRRESPQSILASEAGRLFADRAAKSDSEFAITERNAGAVAQVCRRLDGIPLAIELAAARVRVMPVGQIAARLDDRFRLLTGGSRTALPRQQTLRALVDWSYDLLLPDESRLFCSLSVFAGGWNLDAAVSVCSGDLPGACTLGNSAGDGIAKQDVEDLHAALADKSVLVIEERDGEPRYHLLETMRAYALERLEARGEAKDLCNRHRAYFMALAERLESELTGPAQGAALARLAVEHDNLRSALDIRTGEGDSEAGLRLTAAMWRYWQTRGHFQEGRWRLETALALDRANTPTELRAKALNGLAGIVVYMGEYERARAALEESLAIRRRNHDREGTATLLDNLGIMAQSMGDFQTARALLEEALSFRRQRGDSLFLRCSLTNIGYTAFLQGDYASARTYGEEAVSLARGSGDERSVVIALDNLGDVERVSGNYQVAHARHGDALEGARRLGDGRIVAQCLDSLARLANEEKEFACAATFLGASKAIRDSIGACRSPHEESSMADLVVLIRSELGSVAFDAAWTEGQAMDADSAASFAAHAVH